MGVTYQALVRQAESLVAVVTGTVGSAGAHAGGELAHQLLASLRERACCFLSCVLMERVVVVC